MANTLNTLQVIAETKLWLEQAVIGLNLCPFAKAVLVKNRIRYRVSTATTTEELAADLFQEAQYLHGVPCEDIETTLLIHPCVLEDFLDYNDFLDVADAIIEELGLTGEIQIASFHPNYQFADTNSRAIENYTNRSPYPILQLLREASIEKAIESFPDTSVIFEKNIQTLKDLGMEGIDQLGVFGSPKDQS